MPITREQAWWTRTALIRARTPLTRTLHLELQTESWRRRGRESSGAKYRSLAQRKNRFVALAKRLVEPKTMRADAGRAPDARRKTEARLGRLAGKLRNAERLLWKMEGKLAHKGEEAGYDVERVMREQGWYLTHEVVVVEEGEGDAKEVVVEEGDVDAGEVVVVEVRVDAGEVEGSTRKRLKRSCVRVLDAVVETQAGEDDSEDDYMNSDCDEDRKDEDYIDSDGDEDREDD